MHELREFIRNYVGHPGGDTETVDVGFLDVAIDKDVPADQLRELISRNHKGVYADVDPLDGHPHDFIELGGWLGDQEIAMVFMAVSKVAGLTMLAVTPQGPVIVERETMEAYLKSRQQALKPGPNGPT